MNKMSLSQRQLSSDFAFNNLLQVDTVVYELSFILIWKIKNNLDEDKALWRWLTCWFFFFQKELNINSVKENVLFETLTLTM